MPFKIGEKYYHRDYESGELLEISQEVYEGIMSWRKHIESKIKPDMKIKGSIQIIGTMSDDTDKFDEYKKLWEDKAK